MTLTDEQLTARARELYAWDNRVAVLTELDRVRDANAYAAERVAAAQLETTAEVARREQAEAELDRVTDERNERLTLEESSRLARIVDDTRAELAQANAKLAAVQSLHRADSYQAGVQGCRACPDCCDMLVQWPCATISALDAAVPAAPIPAPADETDGRNWLVWSNEHCAWWGPGGRRYVSQPSEAGRYDKAGADYACTLRTWVQGKVPPEVAIHCPPASVLANPGAVAVLERLVLTETRRRMLSRTVVLPQVSQQTCPLVELDHGDCQRAGCDMPATGWGVCGDHLDLDGDAAPVAVLPPLPTRRRTTAACLCRPHRKEYCELPNCVGSGNTAAAGTDAGGEQTS